MRIHILYIINNIDNGGTEKQLLKLISKIDRKKFQPYLCTLFPSGLDIKSLNIPIFEIKFTGFSSISTYNHIKKLLKYIKENQINIVQTFFQDPTLIGVILKLFHPLILIGSFRDLGFWRTNFTNLKMKICYPFYNGFIANSIAVKEHYVTYDKIHSLKIRVIYNGIDDIKSSAFQNEVKQNEKHLAIVGIVANLNRPVKRIEDFIKAASIVKSKLSNIKFLVIGDGYLKKDLINKSECLGLGSSIKFLGRIDNPHQYISKFDIGVISSESEGLSNSIIEYMAHGIPVVATNAGGNSELIKNGHNGYLVPVGDSAELARKIIQILNDKKLSRRMCINNKRKINENFSIDKMIEQHERYYLELIGNIR